LLASRSRRRECASHSSGLRPNRASATALALALLAVVGVTVVVYAITSESPWRLTWAQEFNGPSGARVSPGDWVYNVGPGGLGHNEQWQYYTDRPENVSMDGRGDLAVTAVRERLPGMVPCTFGPCDITSARITTKGKFAQRYGLFEARIKVPAGPGMWPAFWMLGNLPGQLPFPDSGEIDAMEVLGPHPNTVYGTVHGPGFVYPGLGGHRTLTTSPLSGAFHVYGVKWSPSAVTWLLDGLPYYTVRRSQLRAGETWPFDHRFYLILDLAVGGTGVGPPTAATPFPARMLVDWIRVYEPS
jgi:beta-glucanase (GH16 family)